MKKRLTYVIVFGNIVKLSKTKLPSKLNKNKKVEKVVDKDSKMRYTKKVR